MSKCKNVNISDLIDDYDEKYLSTISLKSIGNTKDLKKLLLELEKANSIVTRHYEMLYIDFIMSINSDSTSNIDIDGLLHYKSIANRIQKAYNYVMYLNLFNNPFKTLK